MMAEVYANKNLRYRWAVQPTPISLGGSEKRIYALYKIDEEEFEDEVVPAISDL